MTGPLPSSLDRTAFVAAYGHVVEHSRWIAQAAWDAGLPADVDTAAGLHRALCAALAPAPAERKLALFHGEWNGSVDPVFREFAY